MDLTDATALVTGGHRRVGRAIARSLAREGCHVHLTWRTHPAEAEEAVRELDGLGGGATAHEVDLADPAAVERLAEAVWTARGRCDVLVNSASVFPKAALQDVTEADWDGCLAVNLKAPFLLARNLGLRMRAAGCGVIVNLLDWATERPYRDHVPYFVSKVGLLGLTRALAVELAPEVRVNGVSPGPVLLPEETSEAARRRIVGSTPLGRIGAAEDVAAAVHFLVAGTDYATGTIIGVDGGRHLGP